MKVVFVCAPFRAATQWGIEKNVRRVEQCSLDLSELEVCPVAVQCMYRNFHGEGPDDLWLEITMELLRRSDAIFQIGEVSSGVFAELQEARRLEKPIFKSLGDLANWLEEEQMKELEE